MTEQDSHHPLESLIDNALDEIEGDTISLRDLVAAFGKRSFGPFLTVFGLIAAVPPVGSIPGMPTTMGVLILLVAVQMLFGRTELWMPDWLEDKSVAREKVEGVRDKMRGIFKAIDRVVGPRLTWAINDIDQKLVAIICCILALMMPPLELLPFAVIIPASCVIMFGLAFVARDGLLMILGLGGSAIALFFALMQLPAVLSS